MAIRIIRSRSLYFFESTVFLPHHQGPQRGVIGRPTPCSRVPAGRGLKARPQAAVVGARLHVKESPRRRRHPWNSKSEKSRTKEDIDNEKRKKIRAPRFKKERKKRSTSRTSSTPRYGLRRNERET